MTVNIDPLVARMRGFGTTVFAEMTALAIRTGAVNLGQGFPDTDGPAKLLETAAEAILGGANQYPPGPGLPELREAVAAQRAERYGLRYDPDGEVLVTVGATEAIAATLLALCETGDEVIVFEPYYDSYAAIIALVRSRTPPGDAAARQGVGRPVHLRPGRAARRRHPAHAHGPAQLPAQPDRHRASPATSCRPSRTCAASTTWSRSPTRCTNT